MTTTTSSPPSPSRPLSPSSWSPTANDHLIFKWIKLEGKSQSFVASAFGISQPTVSRIIQRYERWQAHAQDRDDGRLDHTERLRAQRWLTFERNEVFLASCIRIAQEMEGVTELSKETVSRSTLHPNDPGNFRTETASIDRSGVAARFLRLAFRINLEQLKLASLDPAPPALPLSAEELADLDREAAETARQIEAAKHSANQQAQSFAASGFSAPASYPTADNADSFKDDPFSWPVPPAPTDSLPGSSLVAPEPNGPPSPPATPPAADISRTLNLELGTLNPSAGQSANLILTLSPSQPPSIATPTLNLEPGTLNPASIHPLNPELGTLNPSAGQPANLILTLSPSQSPSIPIPTLNLELGTLNPASIHPVNNLNNPAPPSIPSTSTNTSTYEISPPPENFSSVNNPGLYSIPLTILIPSTECVSGSLAEHSAKSPASEAALPLQAAVPSGASP